MARITRGSGDVFVDLDFADAPERQTKLRLAQAINAILAGRTDTQSKVATQIGISQPKISALANYRLDGFSVERLLVILTALGRDIDIVVKRRGMARPQSRGRIAVVAA